jgi:hypothetical protein
MQSIDFFRASKEVTHVVRRNAEEFDMLVELSNSFTHFGKVFLFLISTIGCCLYMVLYPPYS